MTGAVRCMSTKVVMKGAEPCESLVRADCAVCRQVREEGSLPWSRTESDMFGNVENMEVDGEEARSRLLEESRETRTRLWRDRDSRVRVTRLVFGPSRWPPPTLGHRPPRVGSGNTPTLFNSSINTAMVAPRHPVRLTTVYCTARTETSSR